MRLDPSQAKFAVAPGFSARKVSAREHGKAVPDEADMMKITNLLGNRRPAPALSSI